MLQWWLYEHVYMYVYAFYGTNHPQLKRSMRVTGTFGATRVGYSNACARVYDVIHVCIAINVCLSYCL